ncbi:MAG: flagellar basal body M-ring protein FliF, partial [Comamonadaceae bacterium]
LLMSLGEEEAGRVLRHLSPQQLEQMTALVRESIGFNKERGDSVNLMNTPFLVETATVAEVPMWQRPQVMEMARSLAWPVALAMLGLAVLFGLVRPGLKAMASARPPELVALPGAQLSALVADEPARPALPGREDAMAARLPLPPAQAAEPVPEQARLEGARQMARQNPVAVANIVKGWINGDAAARA